MRIDFNALAIRVSQREGGRRQIDITQIRELQRILFEELAAIPEEDVLETLASVRGNVEKRLVADATPEPMNGEVENENGGVA